jgi:clan AA aspartic protease
VITGSVNPFREATIRLDVVGPQGQTHGVEAVVDTGFTGSLTLPSALITALRLPFRRRGRALLGDGSEVLFDVFEATVVWDGQPRRVPVDAAATEPLIGMSLLYGYELRVQVIDGGNVVITPLASP